MSAIQEYDAPKTEQTTALPGYTLQQPSRAGKIPKPIMEKRRRARINKCLEELKVLVPDLTESGTRVDKADVLEMTVEHLTRMRNKRRNLSSTLSPHITPYVDPHIQFKQGYQQCMTEVTKLLLSSPVDENVTQKLVEHLTTRTTVLGARQGPPAAQSVSPVNRLSPVLRNTMSPVVPEPLRSTHIPRFAFTPMQYAQQVPSYPSPPSSPIDTTSPAGSPPQHAGSPPLLSNKTHLFHQFPDKTHLLHQLADKTHMLNHLADNAHLLANLPSIARRPQRPSVWRPW